MKNLTLILISLTLIRCGSEGYSEIYSLTDENYKGKKYYFGWGAAMPSDPSNMQNEVKYDVTHTHDIFTKELGGSYEAQTLFAGSASGSNIKNKWNDIKAQINDSDMYVQYSSGHGFRGGLAVGVDYDEMADFALGIPAKEVIVFTMACYSGNLVDSFNDKKSKWENWGDSGRTLFVMGSSESDDTSSTGPGTDGDEDGGPNGSAGSAYGHSLWKSLLGYADGYVDGVKDGYVSLQEIEFYTKSLTKKIGGHNPTSTGVYDGGLIMNRVVPRQYQAQYDSIMSAEVSFDTLRDNF